MFLKKKDVHNEKVNPDGISEPLENLNPDVWDRGYYVETDDGIWYEVYVNDEIKKYYPNIDLSDEEQKETFGKFFNNNDDIKINSKFGNLPFIGKNFSIKFLKQ